LRVVLCGCWLHHNSMFHLRDVASRIISNAKERTPRFALALARRRAGEMKRGGGIRIPIRIPSQLRSCVQLRRTALPTWDEIDGRGGFPRCCRGGTATAGKLPRSARGGKETLWRSCEQLLRGTATRLTSESTDCDAGQLSLQRRRGVVAHRPTLMNDSVTTESADESDSTGSVPGPGRARRLQRQRVPPATQKCANHGRGAHFSSFRLAVPFTDVDVSVWGHGRRLVFKT